jgi:hypothetical protein
LDIFGSIYKHILSSLQGRKICCFYVAVNEGKATLFTAATLQIILILFGILGSFNSAVILLGRLTIAARTDFRDLGVSPRGEALASSRNHLRALSKQLGGDVFEGEG